MTKISSTLTIQQYHLLFNLPCAINLSICSFWCRLPFYEENDVILLLLNALQWKLWMQPESGCYNQTNRQNLQSIVLFGFSYFPHTKWESVINEYIYIKVGNIIINRNFISLIMEWKLKILDHLQVLHSHLLLVFLSQGATVVKTVSLFVEWSSEILQRRSFSILLNRFSKVIVFNENWCILFSNSITRITQIWK